LLLHTDPADIRGGIILAWVVGLVSSAVTRSTNASMQDVNKGTRPSHSCWKQSCCSDSAAVIQVSLHMHVGVILKDNIQVSANVDTCCRLATQEHNQQSQFVGHLIGCLILKGATSVISQQAIQPFSPALCNRVAGIKSFS